MTLWKRLTGRPITHTERLYPPQTDELRAMYARLDDARQRLRYIQLEQRAIERHRAPRRADAASERGKAAA